MAYRNAGTRCWLKKEGFDLAKIGNPGDKAGGWTDGRARMARSRHGYPEREEAGL